MTGGAYLGMLAEFEDALRELIAQRLGLDSDQGQVRLIAAAAVTGYRIGIETWLTHRHEHDLHQLLHHNINTMTAPLLPRPRATPVIAYGSVVSPAPIGHELS